MRDLRFLVLLPFFLARFPVMLSKAPTLHFVMASLVLASLMTSLPAQGSAEDYRRADDLGSLRTLAPRADLKFHWINEGKAVWFRRGNDWTLVDCRDGKSSPLFDEAEIRKLASIPDDRWIPYEDVAVEDGKVTVWLKGAYGGEFYHSPRKTGKFRKVTALEAKDFHLPRRRRAGTSNRGGTRTRIGVANESSKTLDLYWVDFQGLERKYGEVPPDKSLMQSTVSGHLWQIRDRDRKIYGHFRATRRSGLIVVDDSDRIDDKQKSPQKKPKAPRRRASPDGRYEHFFEDHNLHLKELKSGKTFAVTDSGKADDEFAGRVHWSPDSKCLIVFQVEPGQGRRISFVESAPFKQLQPKLHEFHYAKPGDRLRLAKPWLVTVGTRKAKKIDDALFPEAYALNPLHWTKDSREFRLRYNARGHQSLRIIGVDAKSGKARTIVENVSKTFVDYARKQFLHWIDDRKEAIWMTERDGWNHLVLVDTARGKIKNAITKGPWVVRSVEKVDEEKRQVWFWAGGYVDGEDPYHLHLGRVNFDGSNLVLLTEGDGTHKVSFSPDRKTFIDTWSRVDAAPKSVLRRARDGKALIELYSGSLDKLKEAGWKEPIRFSAKGRDGKTDIWGIILRPRNFSPKRRYPVIENIYAGPHSAHVPKAFSAALGGQSMAELGFIVVRIDGMGTSQRSKAFHDVCWKNLADAGFEDRKLWIKAAAKKYPWMDIDRVGIYGGSAGGQNAMRALIDHHDFYRVAVADCGCHDNRMDKIWWNELWMGWPIDESYAKSSNVDHAHRMQGKLMLIVGEIDRNVDPASTMQVVDALIKADKDFDLVVIPGVGHGAAGTRYGRRRQRDFFVRHLLKVEPRHAN